MTSPWTFEGESSLETLSNDPVTLVEGTSFAISAASGDIVPGSLQGLFFKDTRFVSTWVVRLDGERPQHLAVVPLHPFAATFVSRGRPRPGEADSTLLMQRLRYVGAGMREDILLRNLGREQTLCRVSFELDADFAHVFEVKESRVPGGRHTSTAVDGLTMSFASAKSRPARSLQVTLPAGTVLEPGRGELEVPLPAGGELQLSVELRLSVDGEAVELRFDGPDPEERSLPVRRIRAWEQRAPRIRSADKSFDATFLQSERDLGALRIFDPDDVGRPAVAAGAPWFMTLFGRDSLITSIMTLDLDPSLAAGTLLTLGRNQGQKVDPECEEEPGKILHEMRHGLTAAAETPAGSLYYGSIDATPLFVVTLGELHRWGAAEGLVRQLLPHADRALEWIARYGDRDGDGFVEYERATKDGLVNQGWKDSFDGISFADGTIPETPIALCEVQGYVYAAYLARAQIARTLGESLVAAEYEERAALLKGRFNKQFWLEDEGRFALGLDGSKRPIDSLASNMGHCLWSGIVDDERAGRCVSALMSPEMFTGWGIRTLSSAMGRYNPISYHNGSVWPHDSAICAAGMARYGFQEESQQVTAALLSAAAAFGGRPPELFCGFARSEFACPVPYPASCSPQAWASASPFLLLRSTLLGLEPSVPEGTVRFSPHLPPSLGELSIENLHLAGSRLTLRASGENFELTGLPPGLHLSPASPRDGESTVRLRSARP